MPRVPHQRKARKRNAACANHSIRLSDATMNRLRVCRAMMTALSSQRAKDNEAIGDGLRRLDKCLRRYMRMRGIDVEQVIRAAGVKPSRASAKFTGVPLKVRPRVERE